MARVITDEVFDIMESDVTVTASAVTAMITAASALVDSVFATDTTIGTTLLKEIERWLTAHMLASTLTRTTSKERLGDAEVSYTGTWGKFLESTPYGQMVLTLDVTGKMAKAGKMGATMYAVKSFTE